ncbi:MAG TPA: isopeptide-forming domain-containing fimbrial protein, partial [Gemmataceae bacterium]|nr:isopeptide-forming domain-containing fimbrial protein [Gemmataceae bacterium]
MHWTPLSGAKFEDVFGPSATPTRSNSRLRNRRNDRRLKARPKIEWLEGRVTPAITAGVVSSSLSSTTGSNATIGEIVRVRVVVDQDLSGNYDPTAFNVDALLPAGLRFLSGTADMALISDQGIISTLDPNGTGGLNVTGSDPTGVTPTFLIPPSAISTDPTTGALVFNTGISHVNDADANHEFIVIEYNALVTNVAGNQAAPPTTLTSTFQLFVGGQLCAQCNGAAPVTVVEPSITNLTKTAQVSANGSTATYTLTFSNTGNSTAYDVRVVDNVPTGLTLNTGSVNVVGGTGLADRSTGNTLDLSFDSIAPGSSVTITYTAAISAAAQNGQTITNTVNLDYTSLPGTNGENPNPTGSVTPGASGSETGERNGSGGVNDYFDSASAQITVNPTPKPNSISGFVFGDKNHSGDFDAGDVLFSGIMVSLQDSNGNPVHDLNG